MFWSLHYNIVQNLHGRSLIGIQVFKLDLTILTSRQRFCYCFHYLQQVRISKKAILITHYFQEKGSLFPK